ncbi:MAG TPA: hypothetical protein VHP11_08280 [Tepidisphaeraceae bacterium]|nr:hypothetical protein [Tepidisphaeraceae bacterium]
MPTSLLIQPLAEITITRLLNALCQPACVLAAVSALLILGLVTYRRWTHPLVAATLAITLLASCAAALAHPNFRHIVTQPDNIAIVAMLLAVAFFLWIALRQAALHDASPHVAPIEHSRTYTWPDLVYIELICLLAATVALIVWSILVKAPLEQPANPAQAPNPAKAPWYFVGLQELLVYFDPWIAGVLYPCLIILGLCAIPFLDRNPKHSGCYTLHTRRLAISIWLFGFLVLWITPILIGTFLRGPNWSLFGLFEPWNISKHDPTTNVALSELIWQHIFRRNPPTPADNLIPSIHPSLVREFPALLLVGAYFILLPILARRTFLKRLHHHLGPSRYALLAFLLLMMGLLPLKMLLRWTLGLQYLLSLPEFHANL